MRAVVFDGALRVDEIDEPEPDDDEAVIKVALAGICGTDLELVRGYADFRGVPGHEMVGVVEDCETAPQWLGRRVVGEINVSCGRCRTCRANLPTHCERRSVLGIRGKQGAFANFITLPVANLHEVPPSVSDEAAVFTEPLAAALQILQQVEIDGRDDVAIFGDGRLGLLVAMVLAPTGCRLTVVGKHPHKLAIAQRLHAETRLPEEVAQARFDVVIEATGRPEGATAALEAVRPRGVLVLKTTGVGSGALDTNRIVVDEIEVIGSRCGAFEPALEAMADRIVDPTVLIEDTYALDDAIAAFEHARRRGALKILLRP
jgi:threonine dehydrogenase-like Zn-dependent dehydrogenase